MGEKCRFCYRESIKQIKGVNYCQYHLIAYEELRRKFKDWVEAFEELSWTNYLKYLVKLNETGKWVKDVVEVELKSIQEGGGAGTQK